MSFDTTHIVGASVIYIRSRLNGFKHKWLECDLVRVWQQMAEITAGIMQKRLVGIIATPYAPVDLYKKRKNMLKKSYSKINVSFFKRK